MATLGSRIRNRHLTCSICFEFYTVPKTLPCMHSFCEHCLENHIQAKRAENGFGCPMCNTFTNIPDPSIPSHQWAGQFRTDFKLTGMLEELQMIEQEGKQSRDITQLPKLIEDLRTNEKTLMEKIAEDRQTLTQIGQEQEEITQQISDVFTTLRLKLQRKEEALKQRFQQTCAQRKDTTSRSWLSKQKVVDQVNKLIDDAEELMSAKSSEDTGNAMKKIHDGNKQFNAGFGNIQADSWPKLELNMRQEDVLKFDSLVFCEVTSAQSDVKVVPVPTTIESVPTPTPTTPTTPTPTPAPAPTVQTNTDVSQVPGQISTSQIPSTSTSTDVSSSTTPSTVSSQRAPPVPNRKPQLVAVLSPTKDDQDKEPDYQDIIVLRDGHTQMVVLADYNNKKVIALYIKQGTKTQKALKLDCSPNRVCALDSTRVVVSCCDPYKLLFLYVSPELKLVGSIKPSLNNTGITVLTPGTLAIASKNKINVMTTAGTVLKEFKIKSESSFYSMSWYMATTPTGSIIVSDRFGEMISCVTPTGQTLWQWMTPDSTPPAGVTCDKQGRIYVVLTGKKQVCRLSETGQYLGVVLCQEDDLVLPTAMDIDQFGQWYVMKKSRQIQVFKP